MLNRLRAKDIRVAAKRDDGIEYLKEHFDFRTNEEVYIAIRQVLPAEADSIISKMSKKHKRVKRREANAATPASPINVLLVNQRNPQVEQIDEILQSMQNPREWLMGGRMNFHLVNQTGNVGIALQEAAIEEATAEVAKGGAAQMNFVLPENLQFCTDGIGVEPATSYEDVKKREEELMLALDENEKKLEVSRTDTSAKYQEMNRMKESVEKLKAEILQLVAQYKVVWNNYCASAEKTKREEAVSRVLEDQLKETRAQLLKLQRVSICVYTNGNVEVENAETPDISDTDILMEFSKLVSTPDVGNLTINELKGVAKLQIMVKTFRESGREVDVLFENNAVQALWENINT